MKRSIAALMLLGSVQAHATHMSGGEIYWNCLGNNQYEITLTIYRDCAGIDLDNDYDLDISSPCGNTTLNVTTPGGVELSQLCDLELPNSTCSGGNLPGIQQYVYTGVVTLPPCDFWTISWTEIYRNNAIVNLQAPGQQEMYIQAELNNQVAPCDESPQFTNVAIPYVCLGYPISYSYGVFDPQGDSLSYSLISACVGGAVPINYVAPHTPGQPIPGITLDPVTGLVTFNLSQAGNWVVVVQVDVFDAQGNWIGTVMRDMQFIAYPCSNAPPDPSTGTVGGMNGSATMTGPYAVEVCESGDFCFDMVISDPNANNILDATSNIQQNLPGATFSFTGTNPITCTVCWTATAGSAGFFPFIVTVEDGACPIQAFQTYVYSIEVLDGLFINAASVDESCAGTGDGSATMTVTEGTPPYQILWSNGATTSTIQAGAGTYTVSVTDANACGPTTATVTIGAGPAASTANAGPDIIGCLNDLPVNLQGSVTNANTGTWSGGQGTFTGSGLNVQYMPTANEISSGSVTLILTPIGTNNCAAIPDSIELILSNSFLNASISSNSPLCQGGNTGTASFLPNDPSLSYLWNDPLGQTSSIATGLSAGTYSVFVSDAFGCDTTMSVNITTAPPVVIDSTVASNALCNGQANGVATVYPSGGSPGYTYQWSTNAGSQTSATAIALSAGSYSVVVTDQNGCSSGSNVTIAEPLPITLSITAPDPVCVNTPFTLTAIGTGGNGGLVYDWYGLGNGQSITTSLGASSYIPVTVTDNVGCPGPTEQVLVEVIDLFSETLNAWGDTLICNGDQVTFGAQFSGDPGLVAMDWASIGATGPGPFNLVVNNSTTFTVVVTDVCNNTLTDAVEVTVDEVPVIALPALLSEGCAPHNVQFPSIQAGTGSSYLWHLGDGSTSTLDAPAHTYGPGTYAVALTVTTANGCSSTSGTPSLVNAFASPQAVMNASPWVTNIEAPVVQFSDQSIGLIAQRLWTFPDGSNDTQPFTQFTFSDPGVQNVLLWVRDVNGCEDSDLRNITVTPMHDLEIPNAFSPNLNNGNGGYYDPADLSNDVFYPFTEYVEEFRMRIFNRWGEMVFESSDLKHGWDGFYKGQLSPQDVYTYRVWVKFVDGVEEERMGDITLFR